MTRVLHSIYSIRPETGGPARSVPALAEALRQAGVDVRLNVCEASVVSGSPRSRWNPRGFVAELGEWRPEIVHDHGVWLPSNHQAAAAARRLDVPLVVSPRGMLEPWSMHHRRWKKQAAWLFYQGRNLRGARCLHATSPQEAQAIRALGLDQPVIVLPNGVSLPETMPPKPAAEREERVILFMSRLHPKKGLPLLIEGWRRVRTAGWKIRIVGPDEGGHAAEIRDLVRRLGLDGEVLIEPPADDARKWEVLRAADLFVLPTYSENFGIVVAEALAAGAPVLTTTGTPWRDLEAWGAGWCVEPDLDAIAGALETAIRLSDDERRAMGERGRQIVLERYSWPAIARQMRDCYSWIVSGGQAPDCVQLA